MSQYGPWISFNEMHGLNATNTLYVIRFHPDISENLRFGWALGLLTTAAQNQIRSLGRRYADGLRKYEPGGLKQIRLAIPATKPRYREHYALAVQALLEGKLQEANRIAESVFASG